MFPVAKIGAKTLSHLLVSKSGSYQVNCPSSSDKNNNDIDENNNYGHYISIRKQRRRRRLRTTSGRYLLLNENTGTNLPPSPPPQSTQDGVTLCTLGVGTTFGASVTPGKSHSVSVVTSDECTLLRVRRADFQEIFNSEQSAAHLITGNDQVSGCDLGPFTSRVSHTGSGPSINRQRRQSQGQQQRSRAPSDVSSSAASASAVALAVNGQPRPPDEQPAEEEPEEELEAELSGARLESGELMRAGWVLRTLMLHQSPQLIQNRRVQPYLPQQPSHQRRSSRQTVGSAARSTGTGSRPRQLVAMASSSSLFGSTTTGSGSNSNSTSSLIGQSSSGAKAAGRKVASYVASSFLRSKGAASAAQMVATTQQQQQQQQPPPAQLFTSNSFDNSQSGAEPLPASATTAEPVLFRRCMIGAQMVDWLLQLGQANTSAGRFVSSRHQAISMWQVLLEQGVVFAFASEAEAQTGDLSGATTSAQRGTANASQFRFCDHQQAYYKFCFDRDQQHSVNSANSDSNAQVPRPSEAELASASELLWRSLHLLSKLAPDAAFRLMLSKRPEERSLEDVDLVYEELQHLKALSHLTNSVKTELAACVSSEYHAKQNTVIFNQGDAGHSWYIILRGSVNVVIVGKGVVCTLHEGDDFGKLALVNDAPRAATIVTNEPNSYFLRVDKHDFNTILRDVEANTVRLKEHGKEVLILQKVAVKEPPPAVAADSQQQQSALPPPQGEQVIAGEQASAQQASASGAPTSNAVSAAAAAVSSSSSALKYMVMAGTAEKMLEHLLETRIDGRTPIGPLMSGTSKSNLLQHDQVASYIQCHGDNFLEDFILTHKIFMPTGSLCSELLKQYQCQTKSQLAGELPEKQKAPVKELPASEVEQHEQHASLDLEYLVAKKRRVVKFIRCWMLVTREHFFHQRMEPFLTTIQQRLRVDAAKFASLQPELKAVGRILELHLEEDLESRHSQRWIEDVYGNILPLRRYSGAWELSSQPDADLYLSSLQQRRFEHRLSSLQVDDEVVFRVYCVDHSFATLKTRLDEKAAEVKQMAAKKLHLQDKELILVHVKSNGERIIYNDADFNISTSLSVNGRLFVCPLDHIDAISPLPEQDPFQEIYQTSNLSTTALTSNSADANTTTAAAAAGSAAASVSASRTADSTPAELNSHLLTTTLTNYQDMRSQMSLSVSKLEEFSSRDVAYCLSQLAWSLLRNMHESELIFTVFGRHNFKQVTANLNVFLRHFNEIQYWVVTQICLSSSLSKRVQILRKFIKIAAHCKELQNLNAFFAIIMGLSNMAVARLTQTWERLPNKLKRTFSQFESLIDPSRNHRRYRIFISKMEPPIIPFMPLFLKDMTFAHEGNKTYLENGLINFEKMQMVAQTLRTIRYCKSRPMKLDASACKFKSSIRSIELFFRDLKIIDNQRTLTQMSHQLEHRKT